MENNNDNNRNALMWRVFRNYTQLEESIKMDNCNLSREEQDRLYYKLQDLVKALREAYHLAD